MIALKIGVVMGGKKYETVLNASLLLAYLPGWVVRRTLKLKAREPDVQSTSSETR